MTKITVVTNLIQLQVLVAEHLNQFQKVWGSNPKESQAFFMLFFPLFDIQLAPKPIPQQPKVRGTRQMLIISFCYILLPNVLSYYCLTRIAQTTKLPNWPPKTYFMKESNICLHYRNVQKAPTFGRGPYIEFDFDVSFST